MSLEQRRDLVSVLRWLEWIADWHTPFYMTTRARLHGPEDLDPRDDMELGGEG